MSRFTIRDVLWLTVVVAVAFGWMVDHGRHVQLADDREAHITRLWERLNECDREIDRLDPNRPPKSIP